jgi:hypothetical protein
VRTEGRARRKDGVGLKNCVAQKTTCFEMRMPGETIMRRGNCELEMNALRRKKEKPEGGNICLIGMPTVTVWMQAQEVVAHALTYLQSWNYFPFVKKGMQIILFQVKTTALMTEYTVTQLEAALLTPRALALT